MRLRSILAILPSGGVLFIFFDQQNHQVNCGMQRFPAFGRRQRIPYMAAKSAICMCSTSPFHSPPYRGRSKLYEVVRCTRVYLRIRRQFFLLRLYVILLFLNYIFDDDNVNVEELC